MGDGIPFRSLNFYWTFRCSNRFNVMSQSINRIWVKLNMNELNTEVNLGVGSKQVSRLCFIKPIGRFEVSLEKNHMYFSQSVAISFESWMGDPREEMVWGRPSGRAGKKTWGEAVEKPSGEVLPCCKPGPRFQSIHNQQQASSHPTAIPPGPWTLFFVRRIMMSWSKFAYHLETCFHARLPC